MSILARAWVVVCVSGLALHAGTVLAQVDDSPLEGRLLRSAARQESQGDLLGAESILMELMQAQPTSTGGLFALERVLRAQSRILDILPVAERYEEIDPEAAAPRMLTVRIYSELGAQDELEAAAEAWLHLSGSTPEPYREVSRALLNVAGPERALAALKRGRKEIGEPSLFALEMGDLLRDVGRVEEAILEWTQVIGNDGAQVSAVTRRVGELKVDDKGLVKPMLDELGRQPTTVARLRAGTRIAIVAGLFEDALRLGRAVLDDLSGQVRRGFLTALAKQAEDEDGARLALWAYEELREQASDRAETRALDHRISMTALVVGDTARALAAQRSIAESLPESSPDRRRALAENLRLEMMLGSANAWALLEEFREEFPKAPELDELAVTLAVQLEGMGDDVGARSLLAGVEGPKSSLERGYLYLASGDVERGKLILRESVSGLVPQDATKIIALLDLLDRLRGDALPIVGVSVLAHRGSPDLALVELEQVLDDVPEENHPAVLALAARIAGEGGLPEQAARFRTQLIRNFPRAPEVPEATLRLARFRGASAEGVQEAIELLEALILKEPDGAIVPTARRELRILRGGPES